MTGMHSLNQCWRRTPWRYAPAFFRRPHLVAGGLDRPRRRGIGCLDLSGRPARSHHAGPLGVAVLRGFTLMLVVMMLSGPVIQTALGGHHSSVLLYVDASASMKATDEQMETQRKLRILRRLGWLEGGADEAAAGDALDRLGELRRVLTAMAADTANNLPNHVDQGELITKQAATYLEAIKLDGWTENELEAFKADLLDPFSNWIRSRPMKTTKPPCWHYNRQWIVGSKPFETSPRRRGAGCIGSGHARCVERFDRTHDGSGWRRNCWMGPAG